jgi:peptidoglycan-N-acetylglucosamine deacetylase
MFSLLVSGGTGMRKLSLLIAVIAVVAVLAFGANTTLAQGSQRTYVIQPGDSLFSVASRFNVSISLLATINRVYDVNQVYVGQVLVLPDPLAPQQPISPAPVVQQPGYTAPIYTPPAVSYPGGTTVTTITSFTSYKVRQGDFLASIAQRFNTTLQAILSTNYLPNPDLLYVGQLLTIPRTSTRVSPPLPVYRVPVKSGKYYIVQPGDNLFGIAARTGRNAWAIARANGILDLNAIYVGQPLIIP